MASSCGPYLRCVISETQLTAVKHLCALPLQLQSVAECAARLRVLSGALDVADLRLDCTLSLWRQEVLRLQGAALGMETKESLLEAWGLVLQANHQLEPTNTGSMIFSA